jgi:hypothetical protein
MAKKNGEVAMRLLEKFLMPIVATAASAAASYAAKKAPQLLGTSAHPTQPTARSNGHRRIPADELDRRRDERAQGRAERRKAVK